MVWQHALNRWLIASFAAPPWCTSLLETFVVYAVTLALCTIAGAALIRGAGVRPRIGSAAVLDTLRSGAMARDRRRCAATAATLPTSGVLNFWALSVCFSKERQMLQPPGMQRSVSAPPALASPAAALAL